MTTSENVCLLVNISIEANSVDPDQTVPIWIYTVCRRGLQNISSDDKSMHIFVIFPLRVNKRELSVYTVIHAQFGGSKTYLLFTKEIETDFPS